MLSVALRGVFVTCLMKLCAKVIETLFTVESPSDFHLVENNMSVSVEGNYGSSNVSLTCEYNHELRSNSSLASATSWIYTSRYMLPILGGLLASAHLGCVRVLQIGGCVMLISTILLSVSVYLGLMCQSSPLIIITWLSLPVFFGLNQSSILYCIFSWFKKPRQCTIVSAIYYSMAVAGELIALQLRPLNKSESLGPNASIIYICISVIYMVLSFLVPADQLSREPFRMPHLRRLKRYFKIFCGLILFLFTVADTRPMVYGMEIDFLFNRTENTNEPFLVSLKMQNLSAMLVSCLALIMAASLSRRQLPIGLRMQLGILLEAAVSVSLLIFTVIGRASSAAVVAVYTVASVLDAIAEVLLMTGAYDLSQQIVPKGAESFVMGIMFTVWGLSNLFSRIALLIISSTVAGSETPRMYFYHLVTLLFLLACSAYHKLVALPMAIQLTEADDAEGVTNEELESLLPTEQT